MNHKLYRIRNFVFNQWWEGKAESASHALSLAGWDAQSCEIKEHTNNGGGGWKKCKEAIPSTAGDVN